MKTLICGYGEIGKGLYNILEKHYPISVKSLSLELNTGINNNPEIMHITFPYSDTFIEEVKKYQEEYKPKYTIIHSTVPLGVSRKCGAINSPCICQHPFIEEGLRTFPKMLGGEKASEVADYFRRAGIKVVLFNEPETTESAKLFLTEYYRECINFAKRVKIYTDKHNLSFHECYTIPNEIYNSGYKKLGYEEFIRPILQPIQTPISGHCVQSNAELIKLSE